MDSPPGDWLAASRRGVTVAVPAESYGVRLLDFLIHRWPDAHRRFLRDLLVEGRVWVNAEAADRRTTLRGDDLVTVDLPDGPDSIPKYEHKAESSAESGGLLFDADDLLVLDKPAGITTRVALAEIGDDLRPLVKMDADASGCLLAARTSDALRRLGEDETTPVAETQRILVQGRVCWSSKLEERHIGPDSRRPGRMRVVEAESRGARPAITEFEVVASYHGHSMVLARPRTARGHQVRVHLAHLGHPVVADREYGVRPNLLLSEIKKDYKARRGVAERPLLERMFVHVERVRFPGFDGSPVEVVAGLADDLAVVVAKLESFAERRRH